MQLLEVLVTSLPGHAQNRLTLPKNAHPILQNQLHPAHRSDSLALVPKVREIPGALTTALGKEKINPARCQWLPPTVDIQQEILEEHFTPLFSSRQRSKTCGSWAKSCVCGGVCIHAQRQKDATIWRYYKTHFWFILRVWWHQGMHSHLAAIG